MKTLFSHSSIIFRALKKWRKENIPFLAAGLSFYTVFSLVPLSVILVNISTWLYDKGFLETRVIKEFSLVLSPDVSRSLENFLSVIEGVRAPLTLLSGVVFLWISTRIFQNLRFALNIICETKPSHSDWMDMLKSKLRPLLMVGFVGGSFIAFWIYDLVRIRFGEELWQSLSSFHFDVIIPFTSYIFSLILFAFLFSAIYKFLPDHRMSWKFT
jgi:membrane protein